MDPKSQRTDEPGRENRHASDNADSRDARLGYDDEIGPSEEEVLLWAKVEQRRRQAWLSGPTNSEKREWAYRERQYRRSGPGHETDRLAWEAFQNANLAWIGFWSTIAMAPFASYSQFVCAGRDFQERYPRRSANPRVRFDDRC